MAFDEFKRELTLFAPSLLVFSYSHHSEMHAAVHSKLLRALTASELTTRILRDKEWLMLLAPLWHSLGTFSTRPSIIVLTLLPSFYFLSFSFCLVVDIRLCFCWWSFWGEIWDIVEPLMAMITIFVFLCTFMFCDWWCWWIGISLFLKVSFVYMCGLIFDFGECFWESVLACIFVQL